MGTDLLFAEPVTYREVLASLPPGIRVRWQWEPKGELRGSEGEREKQKIKWSDDEVSGDSEGRRPLYAYPFAHVLLEDKCGNTIWMHEGNAHDVKHGIARSVGEASFDKFGMSGCPQHFGET